MASPIENTTNIKAMIQSAKAVRDSGVKNSGLQQGQQASIQPSKVGVEKVNEIPSNSSLNFEDITKKSKDNGPLKEMISKIIEEFKEIYDGADIIGDNIINFDVDENTGEVVVKIVEKETQKVIKQIPPEEMLRIMAQLRAYRKEIGVLIDTEA
jgi:flagellar protein FlaG